MNKSAVHHADDMLVRLSTRATIWMLGTGLLSLHASVFTLSIVGLVFWNIFDSPNDLWVDEVFRRWGVVLAFHAIAVISGWTAWRLLRAEQRAIHAASTTWSPPVLPASTQPVRPDRWQSQPIENHGFAVPAQQGRSFAKRAFTSYTVLTATLARKTVAVVSASASKLTSGRNDSTPPTGESAPTAAQSWPEGPIRLRDDEAEFIARFGGQASPQSAGWTPAAPHQTPANGTSEPSVPSVSKDAGQTWVEAATGGWIAPKEAGPAVDPKRSNGHHPTTNGANGSEEPPINSAPQK